MVFNYISIPFESIRPCFLLIFESNGEVCFYLLFLTGFVFGPKCETGFVFVSNLKLDARDERVKKVKERKKERK